MDKKFHSKGANNRFWAWDRCEDEETILVREMLHGDALGLLSRYGKEPLKALFLKKIHLFRGRNRAFWKLVLDISDEEISQAAKRHPGEALDLWPY